ncbi:hypothetical protein BH09ACT8_BH09ACT8_22520 [soil metagenome]
MCSFHGDLGEPSSFDQLSEPDRHQNRMKGDEDRLTLVAAFNAAATYAKQRTAGAGELPRPSQQQRVLHGRAKRKRRVVRGCLPFQRSAHIGSIKTVALQESNHGAHAKRVTEQRRNRGPRGSEDGILDLLARFRGPIHAQQSERQRDKHLSSQSEVFPDLLQATLENIHAFAKTVVEQFDYCQQHNRACTKYPGRQLAMAWRRSPLA